MKKLFFAALLLFGMTSFSSFAQSEITVSDPDIEFRITKPNGWKIYDDELYYLIYKPSLKNAYVSITYFEVTERTDLEEDFKFALAYLLPRNNEGYKVVGTGDEIIDGEKAKWVKYHSKFQEADQLNVYFMFEKNNQLFKILGTAANSDFESVEEDLLETIKSLKSKKIQLD
ncbi:hypothetical protein [Echinicola sp. 20G]|uniref:hypothetical protein n=1 Tax=Echinicola sp. 20G TaxID=2781961 RepID=UPI001910A844|nr:hypothetical protein [Echinicola sp. 20G]